MTGVTESPGTSHSAGHTAPDWEPTQGDVAALIRALCSQGLRRGVRVVAQDKRGHIFFDQGHVVHAEFAEDVGLGAVIEMLHSGGVEFRPCARPWPSQPSLFFTAEKLLAAARPGAANVITGVRRRPGSSPEPLESSAALESSALPSAAERPELHEPAPLPKPEAAPEPERGEPTRAQALRPEPSRAAPRSERVRSERLRSEPIRAKSLRPEPRREAPGVALATAADPAGVPPSAPAAAPRSAAAPALPAFSALSAAIVPPLDGAVSELSRAVAAAAAAHRVSAAARAPQVPAPREARSRTLPARPAPATAAPSGPAAPAAAPSAPAAAPSASAPAAPAAPSPPMATTVEREPTAPALEREPAAPPRHRPLPVTWVRRTLPARPNEASSSELAAEAPPAAARASSPLLCTSMVRVSTRGVLLAARGEECERLANAAAFIHNQAKLIAADLGRHGRTAVHLRGGGLSLLVVKSEVNDIAAALGPTERLRSLLRKVGLG